MLTESKNEIQNCEGRSKQWKGKWWGGMAHGLKNVLKTELLHGIMISLTEN